MYCRWTSKKNDDDDREPYDSGYNAANDSFAKLDRFSHRNSQGHGNRGNNGSARSISVLPAPKVLVFSQSLRWMDGNLNSY